MSEPVDNDRVSILQHYRVLAQIVRMLIAVAPAVDRPAIHIDQENLGSRGRTEEIVSGGCPLSIMDDNTRRSIPDLLFSNRRVRYGPESLKSLLSIRMGSGTFTFGGAGTDQKQHAENQAHSAKGLTLSENLHVHTLSQGRTLSF
jgi:hypothetical protein